MSPASPDVCRICQTESATAGYVVREMMFGTRDTFRYFQCEGCGCLQIAEFPEDLSPYYPAEYYSFSAAPFPRHGVREVMWKARNRFAYTRRSVAGKLLDALRPAAPVGSGNWLTRRGLNLDARILDVGSGAGTLLYDLRAGGYRNLLGVDPFLEHDIHYPEGFSVLRKSVHEVDGSFDVVMLHHVLEHIPDQRETFASLARLVSPSGYILIRIPVVPSEAWERYGVDWVQLDAPRHLFIHSPESLARLATEAGLRVEAIEYDSTAFQFEGSEYYRQDVPLVEQKARPPAPGLRRLQKRADELNRTGRGDQAAFYLSRA
jgi:SAM-dependent methyltransferase